MISPESLQMSIASTLYPAIPPNHEQEVVEFIHPGEGEVKDWDHVDGECGKTKYTDKCKDEFHCDYPVDLIPWDCRRYECPVCHPSALKRGSVGYREHVWNTLIEMKKAYPRTRWSVSSVIINAPPEVWDMDYEKQHYHLRKAIKHLGTTDVASIYHRWRYRDSETGEELDEREVPWKEYQKNPDRFKRVLGVHWHCSVIGKMVKANKFFKASGWTYKKKRSKHGYALRKKDVYRIAHYALSHTALSTTKRRHAIHYYGNFWRLTVVSKRYTQEPVICPKCENQRVRRTEFHNWDAGIDSYGLEEPAVEIIVHRKWRLRGVDYGDLDCGLDFTGYHAPVKEVDYVDL